jgi:Uma2 family endonuclease
MNIALQRVMTVPEFLAWADAQPERQRVELINGQVVAMAPERVDHAEVKLAAALALRQAIRQRGLSCFALGDGITVRIDDYTAYEPDALVYCGERLASNAMVVPNPVIIVEVLSPSTAHIDSSAKLIGYFKLASVAHYLVIDPDAHSITNHTRTAHGTIANIVAEGALRLDPPGIEIQVADIFD